MRILFVEDDRDMRSLVQQARGGPRRRQRRQRTASLKLARAASYDVMVIDVMLGSAGSIWSLAASRGNCTPVRC